MTRRRLTIALILLLVPVVGGLYVARAGLRSEVRSDCWGWTPFKNVEPAFFERAVDLCVEGKMKHRTLFGLRSTPKSLAAAACGQEWAAVGTPMSDDLRMTYSGRLAEYGVTDMTDDSPEANRRFMEACMPHQTERYEARRRNGGD